MTDQRTLQRRGQNKVSVYSSLNVYACGTACKPSLAAPRHRAIIRFFMLVSIVDNKSLEIGVSRSGLAGFNKVA